MDDFTHQKGEKPQSLCLWPCHALFSCVWGLNSWLQYVVFVRPIPLGMKTRGYRAPKGAQLPSSLKSA